MKNKNLILTILKNRGECSITEMIKILYLIDLAYLKETGNKLSSFSYIRYNYGPFDKSIYVELENLIKDKVVSYKVYNTSFGDELVKYTINDVNYEVDIEEKKEKFIIDLLYKLSGFTALDLTKIAYNTEPMKKIHAKLGGTEGFMSELL